MNPFRRRTIAVLATVVGVSFLGAVLWGVFGRDLLPVDSSQGDAFSRSALGHRAFVALLKELRIPTVVSRYDSGGKVGSSALLMIAEPWIDTDEHERQLKRMIGRAARTLLVLPKWRGVESEDRPGWISHAVLRDAGGVNEVLAAVGADASIVRLDPGRAIAWSRERLGAAPALLGAQLLVPGPDLEPVVACEHGVLLGAARNGRLLVLSDPDLLANHGLRRPGNAVAMMSLLEEARQGRGTVVIDETLHGYGREPSLYRALFGFPLVLATLQALFTVAVLLWAAMGRFGAPQPAAPPLEAGKRTLIDNIATLLAFGGHAGPALQRYYEGALAEVSGGLHLPASLPEGEAEAWLDRNGEARGIQVRLADLRSQVAAAQSRPEQRRIIAIALRIHRWREEMIRGRIDHS